MRTVFAATWWFGRIGVEQAWEQWERRPRSASTGEDEWTEDQVLLDAVEQGAAAVELDPRVNSVGLGGLPNSEGQVELDAALMEGRNLRAGGVGAIRGLVPAVTAARHVMRDDRHLLLVGREAERFAHDRGMTPQNLLTDDASERYRQWRDSGAPLSPITGDEPENHDTVGVIGCHGGHLAVACSTSGLRFKRPGRVGDSPILGAGLYADDQAGAAVCTGVGEEIWRYNMACRVVEAMRRGEGPREACEQVVRFMYRRREETHRRMAAVIAVRPDGELGASATREGFRTCVCREGTFEEFDPQPPAKG